MTLLKETILRLLKERSPEYVSGEEICKCLNVTRTAIWKHMQTLRECGYEIEAKPRVGYALTCIPDRLYPEEILDGLSTRFLGRKIYYFDTLSTTNDKAKELARLGAPEGTLVVTEEQAGGKGRLGRRWFTPKYKGILFSLILCPPVMPPEANQATMLAAVAVASAIKKETGIKAGIKWPNDLLVESKKICGILTELSAEMERINYLVAGIGINVNQDVIDFPEELRESAASLKNELKRKIDRVKLIQTTLAEFERWYGIWLEQGFAPVLARWKELSVSLNCPVRISTLNHSWDGWAEDVDGDGALLLRLPGGELKRVISGEVSLRLS
ncbi:MAG: biotin--[acetyl-CoA-carboxylase] ligase [Desulfotomaculaceae bacterium]|nr:biotin--[acetyl-CoA-carboxylase] ligase [Desulfotomaculaceae bacterium]